MLQAQARTSGQRICATPQCQKRKRAAVYQSALEAHLVTLAVKPAAEQLFPEVKTPTGAAWAQWYSVTVHVGKGKHAYQR